MKKVKSNGAIHKKLVSSRKVLNLEKTNRYLTNALNRSISYNDALDKVNQIHRNKIKAVSSSLIRLEILMTVFNLTLFLFLLGV